MTNRQYVTKIGAVNNRLSTRMFMLSMALILIVGVGALIGIHYISSPSDLEGLLAEAYKPVTNKPTSLMLNVSSPDDNKLVMKPDLLLEGVTNPGSVVMISTNDDDQVIKIDSQGNFSTTVTLQEGANMLTINAFDNLGHTKTETKTVYYSKEEVK